MPKAIQAVEKARHIRVMTCEQIMGVSSDGDEVRRVGGV